VALCRAGSAAQAAQAALAQYNAKAGRQGRILIPVPTERKENNESV